MERVQPSMGKMHQNGKGLTKYGGNTSEWKGLNQVWENASEWKGINQVWGKCKILTNEEVSKPLRCCINHTNNVKMPTIVGILAFLSRINFALS